MTEPADFVDRLRRRDKNAWNTLADTHVDATFAVVCHLVGGHVSLAEDIHQETWAEAIDHIDSFASDRGDLRGWILGIARRRVALHYRRRAVESTADSKQLPRDQSLLPEDVAARVELGSAVRAALLCLPDDHHAVIADKYLLGLSMDEIAAKSGKTTKAVEGLLTRARQQLRTLLKPYARAQRKG